MTRSRSHQAARAGSLLWREAVQAQVRLCLAGKGQGKPARLTAKRWRTVKPTWLALARDALTCLDEHPAGPPPVRAIREAAFDGFRVQSLVLESFPGWQVGLNLYLPLDGGKAAPVLCPCGHGPKWAADHQTAPQVLARHGFAAALFDMPMFGEKSRGNDHFIQGPQALMAGRWSNYYFLIDAVRVLDYLETREDIDWSAGAGITGVSGGGFASILLPLVEARIAALAPVCCLTSFNGHLVDGLYTGCLENYIRGQAAAGLDLHLLAALNAPKPCLVMAGKDDTIFRPETVAKAFKEVEAVYGFENAGNRIRLFMEACRHQYTERMAAEAVRFFNEWLRGNRMMPDMKKPLQVLLPEELDCGTAETTLTMLDDIRSRAAELRTRRAAKSDLFGLLRIPKDRPGDNVEEIPALAGFGASDCRRVVLHGSDLPLPVLVREWPGHAGGVVVGVTDRKKLDLARDGSCLAGGCRTLVVGDICGYGELAPEPSDYDVHGWCSIDRALCDLLYILDETALGRQCTDVMRLVDYACASAGVSGVHLYGEGEASVAVFFAALLHPAVQGAALVDMLGSFEDLATEAAPGWKRYAFLPDVLRHGDIAEFATAHPEKKLLLINPLDARCVPLNPEAAARLFSACGAHVRVLPGLAGPLDIGRYFREK